MPQSIGIKGLCDSSPITDGYSKHVRLAASQDTPSSSRRRNSSGRYGRSVKQEPPWWLARYHPIMPFGCASIVTRPPIGKTPTQEVMAIMAASKCTPVGVMARATTPRKIRSSRRSGQRKEVTKHQATHAHGFRGNGTTLTASRRTLRSIRNNHRVTTDSITRLNMTCHRTNLTTRALTSLEHFDE
jgi:hypothetical protein